MPTKSARPSQVTDRHWLFAEDRKQKVVDLGPVGKWQLFVPQEHVDSVWETGVGELRNGKSR